MCIFGIHFFWPVRICPWGWGGAPGPFGSGGIVFQMAAAAAMAEAMAAAAPQKKPRAN